MMLIDALRKDIRHRAGLGVTSELAVAESTNPSWSPGHLYGLLLQPHPLSSVSF